MIAVWLPTTIFAPVALLRTEISFHIIFRVYDFARSIFHFYGLCVLPAQVYTQSEKTTIILNNEICMRVGSPRHSQKLIPILKTFAEGIVQTYSGITVGGMIVIKKSTILTCLSVMVPYVVLFLQLHIGTTK
ncbi:hypothetical protein DdX_20886 [Ditylenchus destructor]|uniref:Uncharacterized protein n=1 Tax=Ditylenchus destructor TaxID=166010 RepID=A0AAD4MFV2_9BILA|nr:hypothetical protein DdX_20886 [Ditylenchus destructor]